MVAKAMDSTDKRFSLNGSILNIVRRMYPMSAEDIFLEIEEDEDRILSRMQVSERLDKMCEHHILKRVTLLNDKVVYMMDRNTLPY
jgi:Fe2+ or Zn2+ uptake regulation protein